MFPPFRPGTGEADPYETVLTWPEHVFTNLFALVVLGILCIGLWHEHRKPPPEDSE